MADKDKETVPDPKDVASAGTSGEPVNVIPTESEEELELERGLKSKKVLLELWGGG